MDVNKAIQEILEETKAQILANMQSKNINASGRTSRALEVRQVQGGWLLLLNNSKHAPLDSLEIGHPAGWQARGFYYIIKQWTREKGLSFSSERERGTWAYFVARKIEREGTARHRANVDVYTTPAKQAVTKIRGAFARFVSASMRERWKK